MTLSLLNSVRRSSRCLRSPTNGCHVRRCRSFSSSTTNTTHKKIIVDLRSDTVTAPSPGMLQSVLTAPTGDDVFGEDPTVLKLQDYVADLLGKPAGLFCPSGTMANLIALMAHTSSHTGGGGDAPEVIVGRSSHICLWEGGNAAGLAGIHTRQLAEDPMTAEYDLQEVQDAIRDDSDDHCAKTSVVCLENTHNMVGGVPLSLNYMKQVSALCRNNNNIRLHVDGARLANASIALDASLRDVCAGADSVSLCLSKGLGAPLGTVLVGDPEFIRLAKRARKRCGGGMRQAGVVAAMGLYAVEHNVSRLAEDHEHAKLLGSKLSEHGFELIRQGKVETNIIYFKLPANSPVPKQNFCSLLSTNYGVKCGSGYARGGDYFRCVTHLDISKNDIDHAASAMISLALH